MACSSCLLFSGYQPYWLSLSWYALWPCARDGWRGASLLRRCGACAGGRLSRNGAAGRPARRPAGGGFAAAQFDDAAKDKFVSDCGVHIYSAEAIYVVAYVRRGLRQRAASLARRGPDAQRVPGFSASSNI